MVSVIHHVYTTICDKVCNRVPNKTEILLKVALNYPNLYWTYTCVNFYVPFVIKIRSFTHSWLITRFVSIVTQQIPRVEQEQFNLPEDLVSCCLFFSFLQCFVDHCLSFWPLHCLSFPRFKASDYQFGVFKLFFYIVCCPLNWFNLFLIF
jgi:hypothetical protein